MSISLSNNLQNHGRGLTGVTLRLLEYLHNSVLQAEARDRFKKLSDRDLCDIGVSRRDIGKAVAAQISKVGYRQL